MIVSGFVLSVCPVIYMVKADYILILNLYLTVYKPEIKLPAFFLLIGNHAYNGSADKERLVLHNFQ